MKSGHRRASVLKSHYLDEVERLIKNTLLGQWILRVEHTKDVNPVSIQWQQWENALYCVKEANPVIRSIQACRAKFPTHSVRLYAEMPRLRTRFIYPVYRPGESAGYTQVLPGKWIPQASRALVPG